MTAFLGNAGNGVAVLLRSTAVFREGSITSDQGDAGLRISRGSTVLAGDLAVSNNPLGNLGSTEAVCPSIATLRSAAEFTGVTSTGDTGGGLAVSSDSCMDLEEGTITHTGGRSILAQRSAYVEIGESTIKGNTLDIEVSTQSVIGLDNTNVGTTDCDDSVLNFLDALCS